jgi:hypothetical protein
LRKKAPSGDGGCCEVRRWGSRVRGKEIILRAIIQVLTLLTGIF